MSFSALALTDQGCVGVEAGLVWGLLGNITGDRFLTPGWGKHVRRSPRIPVTCGTDNDTFDYLARYTPPGKTDPGVVSPVKGTIGGAGSRYM